MGQLSAYTNTFIAGTKAKATQVNINFTEIKTAHNASDSELPAYTNGSRVVCTKSSQDGMEEVTTTTTEVNYVHGVVSAIQPQIDTKAAIVDTVLRDGSNTATGILSYNSDLSGSMTSGSNEIPSIKWVEDNQNPGVTGYIANLIVQQDSDTEHDINFYRQSTNIPAYFYCTDDGGNFLVATYEDEETKQIDSTWADGDDAGGLASGVSLSSELTLHAFALYDSSSSTVGFGFDTSLTASNLMSDSNVTGAGFDYHSVAPIFSFILDASSNIIDFVAVETAGGGLRCNYSAMVKDINNVSPSTNPTLVELTVPTGIKVETDVYIGTTDPGISGYMWGVLTDPDQADTDPSTCHNIFYSRDMSAGDINSCCFRVNIYTDTSRQIRYHFRNNGASLGTFCIYTQGYNLQRRAT